MHFKADPVPSVGNHGILKFDNVVYATGGGYDVHTGTFRAPVSGMYVFYIEVMSVDTHSIQVALVKEGTTLDIIHAEGSVYDYQGTLLTPVHLSVGERVWVQHYWGDTVLRGGWWAVFSGYLVDVD